VRPRIWVGRKPGRVTLTDGLARGWCPKRGDIGFSVMPPLRACGARPSARWPSDGDKAFRAQTWRWRERRFSRRDALCASANTGPTQIRARHDYGWARERPVAERRQHLRWRDADIAGVRSPPLHGGLAQHGWPYGENSEMTRKAVFSEGSTLCVRLAWPNVCRGIPFSRDGRAKPGHPRGHASIKPDAFLCGRAEPAPCILCMSTKYPGYVSTTYTLEYPVPPRTSSPVPPYPCPVRTPRGRGSWWYGDDEGCWVRVR
jgi:hypothetical protein